MGLENFEPEDHPISFKSRGVEHSFTVRGLNLADLSHLVSNHIHDIEAAVLLYREGRVSFAQSGSMDAFLLTICRDAPGLVAEIISVTAGEPELAEKYARIPISVSVVSLSEILRMTVEEQGGLKNLSAALVLILRDVLPERLREQLGPRLREMLSPNSTGASGTT